MGDNMGGSFEAVASLARLGGLGWAVQAANGVGEVSYPPPMATGCEGGECPLTAPTGLCPAVATLPLEEGVAGRVLVACRGDRSASPPREVLPDLVAALQAEERREREMGQTVRELAATYQELAMAYGTLEALGSSSHRGAMAQAVLERAALALGAEGGTFLTAEPNGEVALLAATDVGDDELGTLRQMAAASLRSGSGNSMPFSFDLGQRHYLACPVQESSRRLGLLAVCRSSRAPFSSREGKLLMATGRQAALAIRNRDLVDDLRDLFLSTVQALVAAVEAKDPYTCGHSRRVAELARRTASSLGLPPETIEGIHIAAVVHDVGKIGVDTGILRKPGQLDEAEWEVLREHPGRGAGIIHCVPQLRHLVADVRHHHERMDGRGYPDHLQGPEIPLGARIIAVCDAYDAMTSERPYRPSLGPEYARQELDRCGGTQFDAEAVGAFLKVSKIDAKL